MSKHKISSQQLFDLLADSQNALDLSDSDWVDVIRIFRSESVLARFACQLEESGVITQLPSYATKHLANAKLVAQRQVSSVRFECAEILHIAKNTCEKLYLLKGAAYCLASLPVSKGRTFSDIDLLVTKDVLAQTETSLKLHGWLSEPLSKYDEAYYREWAHEVPPMKHSGRGTVIDLHHNLYLPVSGRAPKVELFLEGAIETDGFHILRPAAMTLHAIIHLMLNDDLKHAFRDLNDLHLMMTEFSKQAFWEDLLDLAHKSGFENELFLACRYCRHFFKTSISTEYLTKLANMQNMNQSEIKLLDRFYALALSPKHYLVKRASANFAELVIITRAHLKKMPIKILLYHTAYKVYRSAVESLLGKAFFEKSNS
ncbi:hypothetical protein DS2_04685 [Catenovulum agarivorans DS-2]|uniref:Nucleotidyltransferase family protein n=1 Tax=Catenovulum agarivorans DS-2 TaxID=1328313 RepID=W7QE06_9ALTE|nr:nucleotidyltransferase family protein [Catenovulum agarivorans]EWH11124.1 hypothetical protein DS2_04685 [Catenovulum agarivorans DS-2]